MNHKQLRHFLAVTRANSIAAAARSLEIAQPALSLSISKLEHELKTRLFTRGTRGVCLTESGQLFYSYAQEVIRGQERLLVDIAELESNPRGTVVLAMNQATDNILALPLTRAAAKLYPGLDLDLRTGLSYEVTDMLKNGTADIAIIYEDGSDIPGIHKELLIRESMYFLNQRPSSGEGALPTEISFADMASYEVVTTTGKESLAYILQKAENQTGIRLRKRRPYGQLMTSLRFACEGHCRLILPSSAFYHLEPDPLLCAQKITEPEIYRDVYIATDPDRPVRNITLRLTELIRQCTREEFASGRWRGVLNS